MDREAAKGKQSGRTQEIQRLIGRSLRSVTDLSKLGERTIKIDCDVIEADGGTRTASITGGFIVLYETVMNLVASGAILEMPVNKFVAAISVGIVSEKVFLDLDYVEDSGCETDLNLVMSEDQKFIEIQGTAEGAPFDQLQLEQMLAYGQKGILELISMQKLCLGVNV
jgi:ribonuclease PH